ncbi:hypothetical protein [Neisseria weixii]|uniref:hypothetical protein n=1 Tax=Neisseria weixii TaxID=1853276 RepID=UPI00366C141D
MNGLGFYAFVMGATNCVAFLHIHEGRLKIETAAINAFPDGQRPYILRPMKGAFLTNVKPL